MQRHQRGQIWVELIPGKPEAPVQVLQMLGIAIATPYRGSQRDVQVVDIHVRQFLPLLTPADTPGFIDSRPAQISLGILLEIAGWRPWISLEHVLEGILGILAVPCNAVGCPVNLLILFPVQLLQLLPERLIGFPFQSCSHIWAPTDTTLEVAISNKVFRKFFRIARISFAFFSFRDGFPELLRAKPLDLFIEGGGRLAVQLLQNGPCREQRDARGAIRRHLKTKQSVMPA